MFVLIFIYGTFNFFIDLSKIQFSVRPVFQEELVLDSFNMVISGMKRQFTPNI